MPDENSIPKKSKIGDTDDFKISRMKPKIKATNPHKHDEYHELIYLTKGAGFHTIDLKSYQIKTPSLFLVKAGEVHFWEFTEIPDGYVVIFKTDFLAHLADRSDYASFNQIKNRFFPVGRSNHFPFLSLFELIENEFQNRDDSSIRIIASSLGLIFTQMVRLAERGKETDQNRTEEIFREFQELMDRHIYEHHLVKTYAELLHITPKHLNEISKSKTEKTASQLITEKRILEAQRQLLYSSLTISEISHALGFSSPSHFITYFKNKAGSTPAQYRKEKS